jgi:hypothetical protein
MNRPLFQLAGIIVYELRMQWRRRSLPVLMAGLAIMLLLGTILLKPMIDRAYFCSDPQSAMCSDAFRLTATSFIWQAAILLLTLALPIVVAEVIPVDRHINMRELLDSLPLSREVYLAGKGLSIWAGLLIGMAGVALLDGWLGRSRHGPTSPVNYLHLWAFGLAPLALFISGASVLLAAGQPTRRRAAYIGVAVAGFGLFAPAFVRYNASWSPASLVHPGFFIAKQSGLVQVFAQAEFGTPLTITVPIPLLVTTGAVQLVLIWLIVWLWLRWKEGR